MDTDVSWIDAMFLITVKISECKLGPFEYAQTMSKWPARLVYLDNIINYLLCLPDPFPRGLEIDLKGSNTFSPLMLLMHIDKLGFVGHLYGSLFNCITTFQGSWTGATALCIEVEWCCTITLSD